MQGKKVAFVCSVQEDEGRQRKKSAFVCIFCFFIIALHACGRPCAEACASSSTIRSAAAGPPTFFFFLFFFSDPSSPAPHVSRSGRNKSTLQACRFAGGSDPEDSAREVALKVTTGKQPKFAQRVQALMTQVWHVPVEEEYFER